MALGLSPFWSKRFNSMWSQLYIKGPLRWMLAMKSGQLFGHLFCNYRFILVHNKGFFKYTYLRCPLITRCVTRCPRFDVSLVSTKLNISYRLLISLQRTKGYTKNISSGVAAELASFRMMHRPISCGKRRIVMTYPPSRASYQERPWPLRKLQTSNFLVNDAS